MSNFSLEGFWQFKSNRIRMEDGTWKVEHLFGGAMSFSPKQDAVLFVRSDQGSWGYSGRYTFDGKKFVVKIDASTAEDIEGKTLEREIKFINENELLFSGTESHTGRYFETEFIRIGK